MNDQPKRPAHPQRKAVHPGRSLRRKQTVEERHAQAMRRPAEALHLASHKLVPKQS